MEPKIELSKCNRGNSNAPGIVCAMWKELTTFYNIPVTI